MNLGKYLRCGSRLKAYLYINDMIMKYNLGLNLYVVSAMYHIVIILENQNLARIRKFLFGV